MTNRFNYRVHSVHPLSDTIIQVFLEPESDNVLKYRAGQYVKLFLNKNQNRPYSIANAPLGSRLLEFHIRHGGSDPFSDLLLQHLRLQGKISLSGPFGECVLPKELKNTLIFVAGGTGFAPHKAMIEDVLTYQQHPPIHLFWSAKKSNDLYLESIAKQWAEHVPRFRYTPLLSEHDPNWMCESGDVIESVMQTYVDLRAIHVYLAGPEALVLTARKAFVAAGLPTHRCCSDY